MRAVGSVRRATGLGLLAMLIWSTTVGASRVVMERLGAFPGAAVVLLAGGVLLLIAASIRYRGFGWVRRLSTRHLAYAGPLFVLYMVAMYCAVGLATTRVEAIAAGLANYLWPTMILVFAVLILHEKPRGAALTAGCVLALCGIVLAASTNAGGLRELAEVLRAPSISLVLGLVAGVAWGLYSVLVRVHRQAVPSGALGLLLLAAGLIMAALGGTHWTAVHFDLTTILVIVYMALLPTSLAYWLWDLAMRDGDVPALAALSNVIPVVSAGFAIAVLSVAWKWELIGGAALVSLGAVVARGAFRTSARGSREGESASP
ncbi:MAG: EamA family transporter [Candidatus Bipolaricaulota bacterium]|nr:EamA family transporter [Candidatus Bipolaricaulota bacterium]